MIRLRLVPERGAAIVVGAENATVGRESSCQIVLDDPSVSREHATLRRVASEVTVEDQGSANGTFLNSVRVTTAALNHGDSIRFGDITFGVELIGDAELAALDDDNVVSGRTLSTPTAESFSTTEPSSAPAPPVKPR